MDSKTTVSIHNNHSRTHRAKHNLICKDRTQCIKWYASSTRTTTTTTLGRNHQTKTTEQHGAKQRPKRVRLLRWEKIAKPRSCASGGSFQRGGGLAPLHNLTSDWPSNHLWLIQQSLVRLIHKIDGPIYPPRKKVHYSQRQSEADWSLSAESGVQDPSIPLTLDSCMLSFVICYTRKNEFAGCCTQTRSPVRQIEDLGEGFPNHIILSCKFILPTATYPHF